MKAALNLARLGLRVVPLHNLTPDGSCSCGHVEQADGSCSCGAAPRMCRRRHGRGSIAKHPRLRDWTEEASDDLDTVRAWWEADPGANIGVVTGSRASNGSDFFALDVDPENGGDDTLAQLVAEHGPLPVTTQARTGSGGVHYLFKLPGFAVTNAKVGRGLDIRGDGGQIVVAPSRSAKGSYAWVRNPWDTPPVDAPAWLVTLLGRAAAGAQTRVSEDARGYFPPASRAVLDVARADLAKHGPAVDGEAGGLHTVQACALLTHDHALTDDEAWPLLVEWNSSCVPPWDDDDLRERLRRGRKYGKNEFGCRRTLDTVERARKLIADWRDRAARITDEAEREASEDAMVSEVRALVVQSGDPLHRERIQIELMGATGRKAQALALPRVKVRVEAREPTTDQGTWAKYGLELGPNGSPLANMDNAVRVLEHERRAVFFELFSQRTLKPEGEWTDADDLRLTLYMQRELGLSKMTKQIVADAVSLYARQRARDVLLEWLERLRWDGVERIAGFFVSAHGADDTVYTRAVGANFWKAMVARAMRPGCKVDTMVVLEGVQGLKKSSSLQAIAGEEWFAEVTADPKTKDFTINMQGKLLLEVGEMDSFSRAEVAAVKQAITCRVDTLRVPYEKRSTSIQRRSVFVGTTNGAQYLRDDTGGRRFWPIHCERIDLDYIRANREQLFAEAVARVMQGEGWWEVPEKETRAEQEARRQEDPWEEQIAVHLAGLPDNDNKPATTTVPSLLNHPLRVPVERMTKADQMRVGAILKRLGWAKNTKRVDGEGPQKVWTRVKKSA